MRDAVSYNGSSWIAGSDSLGETPAPSGSAGGSWDLLAGRGASGPTGPQGVDDVETLSGAMPDISYGCCSNSFCFKGPSVVVTTTGSQKLVGSFSVVFGAAGNYGPVLYYGLCYQDNSNPNASLNFFTAYALKAIVPDSSQGGFGYSGSATPGAGAWKVGFCYEYQGSIFTNSDNKQALSGWVEVVNP